MSGVSTGTVQFSNVASPGSHSSLSVWKNSENVSNSADLSIVLCCHSQYLPARNITVKIKIIESAFLKLKDE